LKETEKSYTIMGIREYARHRNVKQASVTDAINSGRIADAVILQRGNKKIACELADELWLRNTKENNKNSQTLYHNNTASQSYSKARAAKETFAAKNLQLAYEKKAGKLCNTDDVKALAQGLGRVVRDRLLALPEKLSPILSAEQDQDEIRDILEKNITIALEDLSSIDLAKILEQGA